LVTLGQEDVVEYHAKKNWSNSERSENEEDESEEESDEEELEEESVDREPRKELNLLHWFEVGSVFTTSISLTSKL
jgi:hypothetical protein